MHIPWGLIEANPIILPMKKTELKENAMCCSRSPFSQCGGLVAKLCPSLVTPWTVAHQALLSVGFLRQEYPLAITDVKLDLAPNCQTLQHTTFANKVRELWIIGLKEIVVVLDFK